jgi:hypothetical protein
MAILSHDSRRGAAMRKSYRLRAGFSKASAALFTSGVRATSDA